MFSGQTYYTELQLKPYKYELFALNLNPWKSIAQQAGVGRLRICQTITQSSQ